MVNTVKLYRIDKHNCPSEGPFIFASMCLSDVANQMDCQDPNDMGLIDDLRNSRRFKHHCFAFTALADLARWFDLPMRRWLQGDGFVLSVYRVPADVVCFYPSQATFPLVNQNFPRRVFRLV